MSEVTTSLKTSGLHCTSCSMLVDLTVGDLDGVEEVHTDHATGDTVVRFDSDSVSVDQIVDAIRGVGYDAEPAL
jgi:copper chaperone